MSDPLTIRAGLLHLRSPGSAYCAVARLRVAVCYTADNPYGEKNDPCGRDDSRFCPNV